MLTDWQRNGGSDCASASGQTAPCHSDVLFNNYCENKKLLKIQPLYCAHLKFVQITRKEKVFGKAGRIVFTFPHKYVVRIKTGHLADKKR